MAIPQFTSPGAFHENYIVAIYGPYSSTWSVYTAFVGAYTISDSPGYH
jgi:hypothetical protein